MRVTACAAGCRASDVDPAAHALHCDDGRSELGKRSVAEVYYYKGLPPQTPTHTGRGPFLHRFLHRFFDGFFMDF